MMNIEAKMKAMGLALPTPPQRGGVYTPMQEFGSGFLYASGIGPACESKEPALGKLGREVTLEQGQQAARDCMLNLLAALKAAAGSLDRVKRFVKLLVFVASDDGFYSQPQVANGASQLLVDIFGEEAGLAARSAIGVNVLPGNIPVEIEAIIELKEGE